MAGEDALAQLVTHPAIDVVVAAMVGYAGLRPTIEAIKAQKTIALANKETLVVAGEIICRLAQRYKVNILPVDSEHSAIFQSLVGEDMSTLQNELNKVCAYVGSGEITRSAIDKTVIISIEAKVFQLSRMIVRGEADNAFENLANLFKLREEPVIILSVLSKAFVDMYRVKAIKEKGISYAKLSEDFPSAYKGRSFILDNAANDASRYNLAQLKNALDLLSNADRRLKSTNEDPKTILEELILRLLRV
jgi:DNA polymerase-3 subunit delta